MSENELLIVTGSANRGFVQSIGNHLSLPVLIGLDRIHADGERRMKISPETKAISVYAVNPTNPPHVERYYVELAQLLDAAVGLNIPNRIAVIPYFGYARQNERTHGTADAASLMAKFIEIAGATKIITLQLHEARTKRAVKIPWLDLPSTKVFAPVLADMSLDNPVFLAPDRSANSINKLLADSLGYDPQDSLATLYKRRDHRTGQSRIVGVTGCSFKGRDVVVNDDMGTTLETAINAGEFALKEGARSYTIVVAHGVLRGGALIALEQSRAERLVTTNSIKPREAVLANSRIDVIDIGPFFADVIRADHNQNLAA